MSVLGLIEVSCQSVHFLKEGIHIMLKIQNNQSFKITILQYPMAEAF
jgi:hypothetical protein